MIADWCSNWLTSRDSWLRRDVTNRIALPALLGTVGLRLQSTSANAATDEDHDQKPEEEHHHARLDFSELSETGTYGSAVADLHDALRAFQDGDHKLACLKVMRVVAALAGLETEADILGLIEDGSELRELFNSEQYMKLLGKLVRLIPPTGEPEIDIPLGVLKSLQLARLRQVWDLAVEGEYRLAVGQLVEAVRLPRSLDEALHNTRPATVAPVAAGLVAGYYGYTGRLGRGARSNFFLASFACTAAIRGARVYRTRLAAAAANGRTPLFTGWDEHLLLT